jgi:hypothetical protein
MNVWFTNPKAFGSYNNVQEEAHDRYKVFTPCRIWMSPAPGLPTMTSAGHTTL